MVNWIRYLEFTSLTMTTWVFPAFFIIMGFFWIFYVLPTVNIPFLNYSMIFIWFFLGISWNTRFGVGGVTLMTSFKNYLRHKETKDDRFKAIIGIFFWPGIVIGLIALFIRLLFVK